MKIYRIEHPYDGCGPYTTYYDYDSCGIKWFHTPSSGHPNPYTEFKIAMNSDQYCGFNSIENLMKWFRDCINNFHENGFVLKVYEGYIDNISPVTGQVVFVKKDSAFVSEMELTDLLEKHSDPCMKFGKEVYRLSKAWQGCGFSDAKERQEAYFEEREQAYQRLCDAYKKLGLEAPSPKALSGE